LGRDNFNKNLKYKIISLEYLENQIEVQAIGFEPKIYSQEGFEYEFSATQSKLNIISDTLIEVLDIATLPTESGLDAKLRFAVSGVDQNWQGAEIFLSNIDPAQDDTYESVAIAESPATIGTVITDLTNDNSSKYLTDEADNIEIVLTSGELNSISEAEFLNNSTSNLALIGDEIIQFKNAELIADNNYILSNIKRGLNGTEGEISNHLEGDRFVLLDDNIISINLPKSLIANDLYIKAVSFKGFIEDVDAKTINFKANSIKPLAVVNGTYSIDSITEDIEISWNRRSRIGYSWLADSPPILEDIEKYHIDIIDSFGEVVRSLEVIDSNKVTYSQAQQVEDFGSTQTDIELNIYQISSYLGRGFEANFV
jgi:hypothetical protein